MSHIIISLGNDNQDKIKKLIHHFENIYLISEGIETLDIETRPEQKISLLLIPKTDIKSLTEALYAELKVHLSKDKITDLDIAVNIVSGSGKTHSAMISSIIRLGYGIRFVDIDSEGKIIEL